MVDMNYPNDTTRHPMSPESIAPLYLRVSLCLHKSLGDARPSVERARPIITYFVSGDTMRFPSINAAANELGIPSITIKNVLASGSVNRRCRCSHGILAGAVYA